MRDSDGSTADATVTLAVGGGVNHAAFAVDDNYSVSTPIGTDFTTGTSNGVLANDFSLDFGLVALGIVVDGVVQTGFVRTAAGGSAKVLADGRVVYQQVFSTDAAPWRARACNPEHRVQRAAVVGRGRPRKRLVRS